MRLTIAGCGDAFGSGGRLNTCFHVASEPQTFLIDCGATALIGMRRAGLAPNAVQTIFLSHLHGDHYGGLPVFLLDGQHVSKRTEPLTIVGPSGTEARLRETTELLFPGAMGTIRRFEVHYLELRERTPLDVAGVEVTPFEVDHFCGAPPYALRFSLEGKVLAYSGDTQWVESLADAARGAELFITECYNFETEHRFHLNYQRIEANLDRLAAKRVLLSHMSEAMLARRGEVDAARFLLAEDGMAFDI